MKRLFDVISASFVLLLAWPIIVISAIVVKFDSPGAAFYKSKRAGRHGQPFYMLKLRTMRSDMEAPLRKITDAGDDRVTRAGYWLRRFKIDELPQFWNVLRGDMSIVGPRPEDFDLVERYYTTEQRRIFQIRPGITSPNEVLWYPDLTYHDPPPEGVSIQEYYLTHHLPVQVNEGLRYIERRNLFFDLKIIMQTIYCVLVYSWIPPNKVSVNLASQNMQNRSSDAMKVCGSHASADSCKCNPKLHPEG